MEIIGYIGAIFFAICALPQAIYVWKIQETKSISLLFLVFWFIGEIFTWGYIIWHNYINQDIQFPLHLNYCFNTLILLYLLKKKILG